MDDWTFCTVQNFYWQVKTLFEVEWRKTKFVFLWCAENLYQSPSVSRCTAHYMSLSQMHHRFFFADRVLLVHTVITPTNHKSWAHLGAMIEFITVNKRQNQPGFSFHRQPHTFSCCAHSDNAIMLHSRQREGVCVCVYLCVYVRGSNEAEDEADMKSIRRCQFGLILMLSCLCTLCATRTHSLSHTHNTHKNYDCIRLMNLSTPPSHTLTIHTPNCPTLPRLISLTWK